MESVIEWNTEIPCDECLCLITLDDGSVRFDLFTQDDNEVWGWTNYLIDEVIAWCPLSRIEPYKE